MSLVSIVILIIFFVLLTVYFIISTIERKIEKISTDKAKIIFDKSRSIIRGQALEHLAPHLISDYSAKDMRHIGFPVDFIVFDGLSSILDNDSDTLKEIVLLEIKTASSKTNRVQRRIKECIESGRFSFKVYNPDKDTNNATKEERTTT